MNSLSSKMRSVLIASAALFVSACATPITTTVDATENADIGTFKTYAWISTDSLDSAAAGSRRLGNPVTERRIRTSIDAELLAKGYQQTSLDQADLAIAYTLGARDKVIVRQSYNDFGYRYYGYNRGFSRFNSRFGRFNRFNRFNRHDLFGSSFGYGAPLISTRVVTEGTLVVDVFDNMAKEALWHGAATKRLPRDTNGSELITEAVDSLLGQFPSSASMADVIDERGES